ncbi:MAG TPA: prenyltransferase/squalene oxidase repeat-containing protein [Planctomycetaceae bacterium]
MSPRLAGLALLLALCGVPPAFAQSEAPERDRSADSSGRRLVTPATQQAIDKGLAWLAAQQHEDGSFWSGPQYRREVAVTALAGMAFLSDGHLPNKGRYGRHVAKAVEFLVSRSQPNGLIYDRESASYGPMYGHGFSTLFLAEVYGTTPDERVRKTLAAAVKLIVASQNDEGGWRYHPDSNEADVSVTVSQVMALRAARNCGLLVPKETIDRAVDYVKRCQNPDGGFMYQLTRRGESLFPRSAAGVVALQSAGIYEGREVEKGLAYLMRHLPRPGFYRIQTHYFYGHYYAAQATWQAGGEMWDRWYPRVRDELLAQQDANGRWTDQVCDEYGTAMALLVLQMPNNYLPIFQR